MNTQFLNDKSDVEWLFDTHLKDITMPPGKPLSECRSFVIKGNEDCPDEITLYWADSPLAYEMPAARFRRDDNGDLKEV